MARLEAELDVEPEIKGTYCAWCVGEEEALRLQQAGYTSKTCDGHIRELCEKHDIPLPPRLSLPSHPGEALG